MAGCKVLTRPSRNSLTPVTSATSVTGTPAAARVCADPPVEIRVTPRAASALANATIPVLSLTEISARRIGRGLAVIAADIGLPRKLRQVSKAARERRQQDCDGCGGHRERDGGPPVLRTPTPARRRSARGRRRAPARRRPRGQGLGEQPVGRNARDAPPRRARRAA